MLYSCSLTQPHSCQIFKEKWTESTNGDGNSRYFFKIKISPTFRNLEPWKVVFCIFSCTWKSLTVFFQRRLTFCVCVGGGGRGALYLLFPIFLSWSICKEQYKISPIIRTKVQFLNICRLRGLQYSFLKTRVKGKNKFSLMIKYTVLIFRFHSIFKCISFTIQLASFWSYPRPPSPWVIKLPLTRTHRNCLN